MLLFADDTVLISESLSELQILLNKLSSYCKKRNIFVNTDKQRQCFLNHLTDLYCSKFFMMEHSLRLWTALFT